jgi:hypothetical protein
VSRDQNAGQTREIKIGNRSFENVSQFKYLGMAVTNQNLIQEEIKRRLNTGNACYHLVQNRLSSRLLSKNVKARIYKIVILPVVLYGCETPINFIQNFIEHPSFNVRVQIFMAVTMKNAVALVRTNVSEEHWFLQEPHGVASQSMAFILLKVKLQT